MSPNVSNLRAGHGPALIELVAMRMCGHAHHDDMLYLGKDPQPSWDYAPLTPPGYADPGRYEFWRARDPIARYATDLLARAVIADGDLERMKQDAEALVEREAQAVIAAPWPEAAPEFLARETVTVVVQVNGKLRERTEVTAGTPEAELVALARALPKVASAIEGKQVVREVVVPDRLVNLVVK